MNLALEITRCSQNFTCCVIVLRILICTNLAYSAISQSLCPFCLNIGLSDQYSDGKAARVWQLYIGESSERTEKYKNFLVKLLQDRGCNTVLDVACGTG